ncbi:MAG: 3'-5' exonuclease [Candidatus Gracilibacteria bacterium]|nr:3'-5' exonuclease [Candidatus Gracilibacteria bacterium]
MKILVFDTETTGFIDKKNPDLNAQPYIVQFAGIIGELKDGKFSEISRVNQFIKPKISIPFASSQVHHIYDIDVKNAPAIEEKIIDFTQIINDVDAIIGHNIEYDEEMIKLELKRLQKEYLYKPKQVICTMKTTVDFCAIKGNSDRFKYPKLGELYKTLFGEYFIGAHDAMVDVEATLKAFLKLESEKILILKENKNEVLSLF